MKKIELKKFNEVIYYDECDNGLPIYMWVNERVSNFYATLSVKYGSVDTEFKFKGKNKMYQVPNGIAHFLEHVKFNEPGDTTAHEYFNKLGSSINAFTTFDYTSYEVFASSNIKENIEHLLDYVQTPYFTKQLIEKEKGIIISEVNMGKNNPGAVLYYALNNLLYHNNKRKNLVTGEVEDVKSIEVEDVNLVYDTFYHPKNMFMVVTGNFDPYEVASIIKENQSKKEFKEYRNPKKMNKKEDASVVMEHQEISGNVTIPKVKVAYKIPKTKFKKFSDDKILLYTRMVLNANFGTTSKFREELLESQLITRMGFDSTLIDNFLIITFTVETKYPHELIKMIKSEYVNLSITKQRLERKIKTSIADIIYGFDDIEYMNSYIQDNIMSYNKILSNTYSVLKGLNVEEASEIIKYLNDGDCCSIIMSNED